jgi:hypothetical protein
MRTKNLLIIILSLTAAGATFAQQPPLSVPVVNHPCQDGPKMVGGRVEIYEDPLEDGFVSIFNGTNLTGWWENCARHTTDKNVGGVWIVDPNSKILYSREEGPNGNILVSNQNYDHYEFVMDLWPTYGNDGGIFNRVTKGLSCWQTTIDYIQGSGIAGSYNENSWTNTNINDDPIKFSGAGEDAPDITTWTSFTRDQNPSSFGCSASGCVSSDFPKVWNKNGWNQIRVKFYGGLVAGETVKMETWIRKVATPEAPWVPMYKRELPVVTPAGPIGIQIHGGGRWRAGTYNLYRNIKVRKLDKNGNPLVTSARRIDGKGFVLAPAMKVDGGILSADLDASYAISLRDVRGNLIENISAAAGSFRHVLPSNLHGIFFAELRSDRGRSRLRLMRI